MTDALLAVDAALESGRAEAADPLERELQEIALALRADAPVADEAFRERLDGRVQARFGRARAAKRARPPRLPSRGLLLAGASAVLVLVMVVGALSALNGGENEQVLTDQAVQPAPGPAERQSTGETNLAQRAGGGGGALAPLTRYSAGRRVERTAQLTLAAAADRLDGVADRIVEVTDRHRGVVLDSSVSTGEDSARGGSFSLRVPVRELTETMRDLSRLGEVRARSETSQDVTRSYDTLADRLTAARVERRGLLRRLAHTESTEDADRLRARLDRVAVEIRDLRTRLDHLRGRTDYTRIAVTLVEDRPSEEGGLGGADDALRGSLDTLVGACAIVLRVLAAVLPFALLAALAWAAAATLRRRRREAVLS